CGPCSEIFYDHGERIAGGPPGSPDEDGDRFIEIWNLVFMQYEQHADGTRTPLPTPSIDTGMGLERIAAILQNVHNNYDIDTLHNIITALANLANSDPEGELAASHKVVADHLRASAFLIADGVFPANDGRGYVLRRIMRRGMRHLHMLGLRTPTMHQLVPVLVQEMGEHYTELRQAMDAITDTLWHEEERFIKTLSRGLSVLSSAIEGLSDSKAPLPGNIAFKLYDTYGFPLDLTADILRNQSRSIAMDEFDKAMEEQRERARKAWKGSGEQAHDDIWFGLSDAYGPSEFLGYNTIKADGIVQAIIQDGKRVQTAKAGAEVAILCNQTPFYGESGGQQGDQGRINFALGSAAGPSLHVHDTQKKLGHLILHYGTVEGGAIHVDDTAHMQVDSLRRQRCVSKPRLE
ncbi:MAG: alanine--tRNA ligase-related protein, partial [Pseudomonadota bacterium]